MRIYTIFKIYEFLTFFFIYANTLVYILGMKTYKYRLYPTKKQARIIVNQLEICRQVYNKTLETKINAYKEEKKNLTLFNLNKLLKSWKEEEATFKEPYSQCLYKIQEQVDFAFSRFFAKQNKFPRFKGKGRLRSLKYTQSGFKINGGLKKGKGYIEFSKIGTIKCKFHRILLGKIKSLTIVKNLTGKVYVCITTDTIIDKKLKKTGKNVGIDLGIRTLATLSDKKTIKNPKFIKKFEKEISKLDRRVSKNKSEKNYHSRALAYEKIANSREDFCNKQANKLVKSYDIICFEKLNKEKMQKDGIRNINKAISDACWGRLVQKTICKAESADKQVVLVEPQNTSKTCSRCGSIQDIELKELTYKCKCGLKMNRDLNASINIMRLGLQSLVKA